MIGRWSAALVGVSVVLAGCAQSGGEVSYADAPLDTDHQKASYGIGLQMGSQLVPADEMLDRGAFMRGFEDALAEADPALTPTEMNNVIQAFVNEMQSAAAAEAERAGAENASAGEAYLAENGARDGVTTTASGLQYEVLREGSGPSPTVDQRVRLHYRGTLIDGTEFDSSYDGDPAEFAVGRLIAGFTEALLLMQPGSHFRIVIPSDIAYGPGGSGRIGPNSTLIFEIELLEILGE